MGAREVVKQYRTAPYDVTTYQTTHVNGGAIMGTDPGTSALNRYLQCWDVPNLFVTRRQRLSPECRIQPDRNGGRRLRTGRGGHPQSVSETNRGCWSMRERGKAARWLARMLAAAAILRRLLCSQAGQWTRRTSRRLRRGAIWQ